MRSRGSCFTWCQEVEATLGLDWPRKWIRRQRRTRLLKNRYQSALPAGAGYWKYGKTPTDSSNHWYQFPGAVIAGSTVTLTLNDGQLGDDDASVNGVITLPSELGVPDGGAIAIPTLSEWGMIILASLMALFGVGQLPWIRRR